MWQQFSDQDFICWTSKCRIQKWPPTTRTWSGKASPPLLCKVRSHADITREQMWKLQEMHAHSREAKERLSEPTLIETYNGFPVRILPRPFTLYLLKIQNWKFLPILVLSKMGNRRFGLENYKRCLIILAWSPHWHYLAHHRPCRDLRSRQYIFHFQRKQDTVIGRGAECWRRHRERIPRRFWCHFHLMTQ